MLFSPTEYIDTLDSSLFPAAATASYVYYTVMGTLIMLNLLITLMGAAYEDVREDSSIQCLRHRAELLMDFETSLGEAACAELPNGACDDWVHMLLPTTTTDASGASNKEGGIVNGVKRLLANQELVTEQMMEAKVDRLRTRRWIHVGSGPA